MDEYGFWFGLVGAVIAIATLGMQWLDRQRTVKHDEISYLQRQVADLQRANELCEMRCEELREEMIELMGQLALTPAKRRARKRG